MKPFMMATLTVLMAGCATQERLALPTDAASSGLVGVRDISGNIASTTRMALAPNESFLMPLDDSANAVPAYPDSLLVRRLPPQAVCLRVSIDSTGSVLSTAPVAQMPHCPGQEAVDAAFFASAAQAVAGWRFEPALRCVFPHAQTRENTYGSCGGYPETAEAVSLTYRFVFEQKDGRGSVRMSQ